MSEEKKEVVVFQVGNIVKFKQWRHEDKVLTGEIVATRADKPGQYLVVWTEPQEQWIDGSKLSIEGMESLKKIGEQ